MRASIPTGNFSDVKPNTENSAQIDAREMFWTARLYTETAEHLFHRAKERKDSQLPTVILASLAVEIFLKCLLKIETGDFPKSSHDLHFIFKQISRELRDQIRIRHDAELSPGEPKLSARLESGGLAFDRWRYPFGSANDARGEAYGLNWLGEVVKGVILERHPEWNDSESTFPAQ